MSDIERDLLRIFRELMKIYTTQEKIKLYEFWVDEKKRLEKATKKF